MEVNVSTKKEKKLDEREVWEYVAALREQQKKDPAPAILRSKINELACELYLDGYVCSEIASLLSLHHGTPYKILVRKGIYKKPEPKITGEVEEKVVGLYRQGYKLKEIAGQMNICETSVGRIINRNNVSHRHKIIHTESKKPDDRALKKGIEMYKEGFTVQEIVAALGLYSSHYLYNALRECGIPMREGCRGSTKKRKKMQERAIHLYQTTDIPLSEILKKTVISSKAFRKLLMQREIPLRTPAGASDEQKEEAVRLYQQGCALSDIRKKTGVHSGTLGKLLKKRSIPLRIKGEAYREMKEEAVRLYRQGETIKEIEKQTGIRRTVLGKTRKEMNVPQDRKRLVGQKKEWQIVCMVKQNKTTKEIAKRTGIKTATINAIRKRYNVSGDRRLTDEEKEEALRLYRQGDSMIEIERRTRVYHRALVKLLKERNIPVTIKNKAKKAQKGEGLRKKR